MSYTIGVTSLDPQSLFLYRNEIGRNDPSGIESTRETEHGIDCEATSKHGKIFLQVYRLYLLNSLPLPGIA